MGRPRKLKPIGKPPVPPNNGKNPAEYIICKYRYNLDEDQQDFIKKNYDNPEYKGDLVKLARMAYQDPSIEEDSEEIQDMSRFILRQRREKSVYNFTLEEIDYIVNNGETMSPIELCRHLLPAWAEKGTLVIASQTASELVKAHGLELQDGAKPQFRSDKYSPPSTLSKVLAKINAADINAKLHINDLKADSRKRAYVTSLYRNMHSARFIAVAASHKTEVHRDLFETEFVRHTYDKPDLTAEECNSYISLCNEYVISIMLTNQLHELNDKLSMAVGDDEETRKYNKNISDSRAAIAKEYDSCCSRMKQLQESLHGKRKDRLALENQANESLAKWVDLVVSEEGRERLKRLSMARNLELQNEIARINSFSDMIAQFAGVSAEEILKCKY